MAATAKKPDGGSSDHARRPRPARTSSSLSASSAGSASDSLTLNLSAEAVAALPPPGKFLSHFSFSACRETT